MIQNAFILVSVVFIGFALVISMDYNTSQSIKNSVVKVIGVDQEKVPPKNFEFTDLNGDTHTLSSFKGTVIILNFWASWCPPCIKEFPDLIRLSDAYEEDLVFIAISSDFEEAAMRRFLSRMREEHPEEYPSNNIFISLDQKGDITRNTFHIYKLPETFVIDKDFLIHEKIPGANWTYEDMVKIVEEALHGS